MKVTKRLFSLTICLALALESLPGAAMAVGMDRTEEADSPKYYEYAPLSGSALAPLAEEISGSWEGESYWDEDEDEWKHYEGTWTLDAAGTLTIEGTGIPPWDLYKQWDACRDSIRRVIIDSGITKIHPDWFSGWYSENMGKHLTEVVFPDTVTAIENYAFYGCTALTSVTFGENLTAIGNYAFKGTPLTSLTLPASLTEIGTGAFAECDQLDAITVAPGSTAFKAIDGVVFSADGDALVLYPSGRRGAYTVPAGVKSIGPSAFRGARGLTAVTLPAGVSEIGESAFYGCDALAEATLSKGLETMGDSAFEDCGNLTEIKFPDGLKTVGASAFSSCSRLTEALLPEGLEAVGESIFSHCWAIKSVSLPGTLQSLGENAFQSCFALTDLTFGEGISRIENRAFQGCSNLRRLMLPKSLTYIGSDVFTTAEKADIHYAGTQTEWEAVRKGYNALPNGVRVLCSSAGPVEPDLDEVHKDSGWPYYDWEKEVVTLNLRMTIDNGGPAGKINVLVPLYAEDGQFLGIQERTLSLEAGERTYDLGTLEFPGIERGATNAVKVFLTGNGSLPLCEAL